MLPDSYAPWPPPELVLPANAHAEWSAWWSGKPAELSAFYRGHAPTEEKSFSLRRDGVAGSIHRFFWGQPTPVGQQNSKLHIPMPKEIAGVSADLLYGQPPQISLSESDEDQATQDRIDELFNEAVHTQLHEAAESGSALGHSYRRVSWDMEVDPTGPIIHCVDADMAYPEYRYNRLMACTFVSEWDMGAGVVLRHLERHTVGLVEHGLYVGDDKSLGKRVPLSEHPETAGLLDGSLIELPEGGEGVPTGLTRLAVVAVPNVRATETDWRHTRGARDVGAADIAGSEHLLDALDDVYTSWMRDIRHGRSRLHVPQQYLEPLGIGKGAVFDLDKDLYVGMQAMSDGDRLDITATQFKIRYQEHNETALGLIERIASGAGYSPQTFGLKTDMAFTATESWARQTRTQNTRNAKIRRERRGIVQLVQLALEVDRIHFKGKGDPDLIPEVAFPETVSESQRARAETIQLLRAAQAASIDTAVRMEHPDWDDEAVEDEVAMIRDEEKAKEPVTVMGPGGDGEGRVPPGVPGAPGKAGSEAAARAGNNAPGDEKSGDKRPRPRPRDGRPAPRKRRR